MPLSTHLVFTFSENLDHKSFENAIFISPNPIRFQTDDDNLRFKWRGKKVEVIFPDSLREQRTYVVTLGTDIRDLRSNRMKDSFTLAFSTGDSLDQGEISGRVYAEHAAGILILAYVVDSDHHPDPAKDYAEYNTQVGQSGEFKLSYLAPGRYRVFALADRDGDRLYSRGEEQIGVPARDIVLQTGHESDSTLGLRLAQQDTLKPTLASVSATSINQVEWRFDEVVSPRDSLWPAALHLISAAGDTVGILVAAPHPLDRARVQTIVEPLQLTSYRARADSVFDSFGNAVDSAFNSVEFSGTTAIDTLRPRILRISIADSSRDLPLDTPVELTFSEVMRVDTSRSPILVSSLAGSEVAGTGSWPNPQQYRFDPAPAWESRTGYVVEIFPDSIFDWNGNALDDTTGKIVFWTLNADTLASISGTIADADSTGTGPIHVTARQISGAFEYKQRINEPGAYSFPRVLPGLYQISAFRDANANGHIDPGTPWPYVPAERYIVWPDTIKVRSRWPNEGNDFVMP